MAVSELRKRRLRAVARLHDEFVQDNLDAPFDPQARPGSPDYNVHHLDMGAAPDAEAAYHREAAAIEAGLRDDQL